LKPTEELYYRYAGVITGVVNKYAYQCPDLTDDLQLQAALIFCQACITYDPDHPSQASFETWLRNKLQSISELVKDATRGPCLVKFEKSGKHEIAVKRKRVWSKKTINPKCAEKINTPVQTVKEISDTMQRKSEDMLDISDVTCGYILEDYGNNLSGGTDKHDFPSDMLPYIHALRGDSLQVFKDFCEGRLERKPHHKLTREIQRKRGILSPSHIYNKFYKQKGWTRERVENAWRGLHGVLKNYLDGKLPSYVNNPLNRTNKVSKSEGDWSEMCRIFEARHNLPYSVYRHLRRKGLVPKLGAGEDYVDLSKYMFDTFAY